MYLVNYLDSKKYCFPDLFIYLSKAFDMVDHNSLLGKMSEVCIRGNDLERAELILKELSLWRLRWWMSLGLCGPTPLLLKAQSRVPSSV